MTHPMLALCGTQTLDSEYNEVFVGQYHVDAVFYTAHAHMAPQDSLWTDFSNTTEVCARRGRAGGAQHTHKPCVRYTDASVAHLGAPRWHRDGTAHLGRCVRRRFRLVS